MNPLPKEVKTNLEYLRKLFIMPDSPDKFIEFGHDLLEMLHDLAFDFPKDIFDQFGAVRNSGLIKYLAKGG